MVDAVKDTMARALYAALRAKDPKARERMIAHFTPQVAGWVRKLLVGQESMQDEVRGEARLALVAAVNYLARPGAAAVQDPAAYIYRSVTNAALRILQEKDLIRAPQSSQRKWAKDGRSDPRPKRHPLPVEELSYDIRAEIQGQSAFLDKILETCCETERERTVVELIANGGDVEDAADAIETSSQTVYRDLDAVEGRYETRFGRLKWLGAAYDALVSA